MLTKDAEASESLLFRELPREMARQFAAFFSAAELQWAGIDPGAED